MTSKNSIYKMTLEHLRHSGWMIALSFIGNLVAGPFILLFEYSERNYDYTLEYIRANSYFYLAQNISSSLADMCGSLFVGVAMIGALIVALGIFYYLFQSSKVDLYHSLPLTRKELFLSGYMAGFLIWFIPFLISCVINLPLAIFCAKGFAHINMILVAFLKMLVFPLLAFIIIYHLCLVAVMLSGNMSNTIITTLVFGLAPIVFYGLFVLHFEQYFDTFYNFTVSPYVFFGLSPIATPIAVQSFQIGDMDNKMMVFMIIAGLLIAVVNFFVALTLCQKRKSELAGRGMENKSASFILRFTTAFAAGLFGVTLLYWFGISNNRVIWSSIFCIFFAVFTFAVISAVQKKTVKGLFTYKLQMVATTAIALCFILVCRFDVFGYDDYLPSKDSIKNIEIDVNGIDNYYYYHAADQELFEYGDIDVIYNLLDTLVNTDKDNWTNTVIVKVNKKNGLSYYRSYLIATEDIDTIRPIVETDDYLAYQYKHFLENEANFDGVYITDQTRTHTEIKDKEQTQRIWEAYKKDLAEHDTLEKKTEYINIGYLDFSASNHNQNYYMLHELPIHNDYVHTLTVLEELYPNLVYAKEKLDIRSLNIHLGWEEEKSFEEYYLDELMPDAEDDSMINVELSADLKPSVVQTIAYREYTYEFTDEETQWLLSFIEPGRDYYDSFGLNNYTYFGEMELTTGSNLSCYIKKGSMTVDEIQKLAQIVEAGATVYNY